MDKQDLEHYLDESEQEAILEGLLDKERQRRILQFIASRRGSDLYDPQEVWSSFYPNIKKHVLKSYRRDIGVEFWDYFLLCLERHCRHEIRHALKTKSRECSISEIGDSDYLSLVLAEQRTEANPEDIYLLRERRALIEKGINQLHRRWPALAQAVVAIDLKQGDLRSVAAELGIRPGNLRLRLHRGRRKLKEILETSHTERH